MDLATLIRGYAAGFRRRSARALHFAERNAFRLALCWGGLIGFVAMGRLAMTWSGHAAAAEWTLSAFLYLLVAFTPLTGLVLAGRAFPAGTLYAVAQDPLARPGRWRRVDALTAHSHPDFGAGGLMTGLVIGLLISITLRTGEFLMSVPALSAVGDGWARDIFFRFAADCLFINLLYAVAFVMAVRNVPAFPPVMMGIWCIELLSQLFLAHHFSADVVPAQVAEALTHFTNGNFKKILISISIWLPYLLISTRANLTYRGRIRQPYAPAFLTRIMPGRAPSAIR